MSSKATCSKGADFVRCSSGIILQLAGHRNPFLRHTAAAVLALCLLVAPPSIADQPAGVQPAISTPILVTDAWIRAIPGADTAAAYMTLRNSSGHSVTVQGVQSAAAAHVMIHETSLQGGMSRMRPHAQIVIAAGATVKLEPGGLHVMLQGLAQPLNVGQSVPLVVLLTDGTSVQAEARVRPLAAD